MSNSKKSAGILVYRSVKKKRQYFLVHPGGPFWKNKDEGSWSLPKGELNENEEPLEAAKREFFEETGQEISGKFIELKPIKQSSGKLIFAWVIEGIVDEKKVVSNTIEIQWPPKSGKRVNIPEVDRGEWFEYDKAVEKIVKGQVGFLNECESKI